MSRKEMIGTESQVPLSPALKAGGLVFVSGQVPTESDGRTPSGVEDQTRLVLDKMKELLEEAGSSMDNVVKTTVFLRSKSDFPAMNAIYSEYFSRPWPSRSTVECDLMIDIRVEIEAIALA